MESTPICLACASMPGVLGCGRAEPCGHQPGHDAAALPGCGMKARREGAVGPWCPTEPRAAERRVA